MHPEKTLQREIFDPPGGILIWILIFLELFTFGLALIFMGVAAQDEPSAFHAARLHLNVPLGTLNTILLLVSGYFIAEALRYFKAGAMTPARAFMRYAMIAGWGFIAVKSVEFGIKSAEGLTMGSNTFYTFYWLLAGFHFVHVLIGLVILFLLYRSVFAENNTHSMEYFEAGAAFWHMCDLIWLLIFPMLYLYY